MSKFEENKWYQLVDVAGFADCMLDNAQMARVISKNGIFRVTEASERGTALVVEFVTGLVGAYDCRDDSPWVHLDPAERHFFEEVLPPHAGYQESQELSDTPLAEISLVINAANAARSINIIKAAFL